MSARTLWARIGAGATLAVLLLLVVAPPLPHPHLSPPAALAVGAAAGAALFGGAARRLPRLALRPVVLVLGVAAASEEVVWRRVVLGELLPAGAFVALAVSSAGFAVVHPRARLLHLVTGASFGGVYLATGSLAASIGAHWTYNSLVGSLSRSIPR